ncbi:MAG TPA: hypothetical protein VMA34_12850 [Terracidiphilus sp.]|nr:hypothetical protein [Terracidiphilus sp.]
MRWMVTRNRKTENRSFGTEIQHLQKRAKYSGAVPITGVVVMHVKLRELLFQDESKRRSIPERPIRFSYFHENKGIREPAV